MARTRYKPQVKQNQTFTLNITSMTDMFTILLVFLLQNFAAGEARIQPVENVRLPTSNTEKNPVTGVQISLSAKELKMDQTSLAAVENQDIVPASLDAHDPSFIKPLFEKLNQLNNEAKAKNLKNDGQVLFLADQDLPYSLIRKVMYTASMAGYPNLKMITTAGE